MNTGAVAGLVLGLWAASAAAAVPQPDDFAFGATVRTEGEAPLWRVTLPEDVYRHVVRPDLGDVRVFDAVGRNVPYTLRQPAAQPGTAPAPVGLPLFPLNAPKDSDAVGQALRIITDDRGHIVNAISAAIRPGQETRVAAYLLDASALKHAPNRLILSWAHAPEAGFVVPVRVEASDDLSHWRTLAYNVTLADLRSGGHTLIHRDIDLPPRRARYLRLSWPRELAAVRLTGVEARFAAGARAPERHWLHVQGAAAATTPPSYLFDSGGYWPADQVRVSFPGRNAILVGTLSSRSSPSVPWRARYRGLFYSLNADGTPLRSDAVTVPARSDRYWKLDVASGEADLRGATPVLELGWVPRTLTFVAQGEPPYTVAYGNALIGPPHQPVDALLRTLDARQGHAMVKSAQLSEPKALGGVARLSPPPPPLPWRRWLLWAVLGAGVLVLAWMVRRLYRQMNSPGGG